MKILLKTTLSTLLAASMFPAASAALIADEISANAFAAAAQVELNPESIKLDRLNFTYNGSSQTPKVTVSSNGKALIEGTDFLVQYPEDCVNSGLKTVSISGLGSYTGTFSTTYRIVPLDISDPQVKFTAEADSCTYNGFAHTPNFRLTANGVTISDSDYEKKFSNNVNASDSAVCEFTFSGNFTGKRHAEFTIAKADRNDLDIEIPITIPNTSDSSAKFTYDLSKLLPDGARFGAALYSPWDFPSEKPTVAFNELHCTVDCDADNIAVSIPVLNANNYSDFSINFYFRITDKILPELYINPIVREYNEKPVTEEEIERSGSYAYVNGKRIEGRWIFWTDLTAEPHTALPSICTFQPDDPAYESVDAVINVTVNKISAPPVKVRLNTDHAEIGRDVILTVEGIHDELQDKLKIECSPFSDDFTFEEYPSKSYPRFKLLMPYEKGIYTITASLPGDEYHESAASSATINIGRYVPPEEQITDKVTTEDELAELIAAAPLNGFIAVQGMRTLPQSALQAASQKQLTIEVKLNDTYTWILQTSKYSANPPLLNLELGSAAIPPVLIEKVGGTSVNSFTVSEKKLSDGAEIRVTLRNPQKDKFANLFYYNSLGELEFISCSRIEADNTFKLPVSKSGKYTVITDNETKLFGDINDDCKFKLDDLYELLYIYTNRLSTPDKLPKYDIDGDGKFMLKDLYLLLRIYTDRQ